ncbi:MAG TPA: dephospho-CoA kinase [Solirubrobacteraceae bacterium]|nr:dephospho-CoA kinase [Solirubrobacteraceae bacterium]
MGLSGAIGAGKSTALEALARLGAQVLSTDAVVHDLYETADLRDAVVARWGQAVAPGGIVDRAAVARMAFASDEDRRWLEQQLWPRVGARIAEWRERAAATRPRPAALVVEVPLLFEAGMENAFDATLVVLAADELRAARTDSRDHAAAEEREARQLPQMEKARRATYTVTNDGTVAELEQRLSAALGKLNG